MDPTSPPGVVAPQTYADYFNQLRNATNAGIDAENPITGRGLLNLFTGNDRAAALARIQAMAPQGWQQYQAAQDALQRQQLGTMQSFAMPQASTGVNIDPNNSMASKDNYAAALRDTLFRLNQGQQAPQGQDAPQAPAPQPNVATSPTPAAPQAQPPLGIRMNNPGNLQPGGQEASFSNPLAGVLAASENLDAYGKQGVNTVAGIVGKWAPQYDATGKQINNTPAYIQDVSQRMGVAPNQPLDLTNKNVKGALMGAMFQHENGQQPQLPQGQAPQPAAPQAQPADPAAPYRALYSRYAVMNGMGGNDAAFKSFNDAANAGNPAGTELDPNTGNRIPVTVATPNGTMAGQDYEAQGAGKTSAAQAQGTASVENVPVITRTGPSVISKLDYLRSGGQGQVGADGKPNWLTAASPQYAAIQSGQQADLKTLKDAAVQSNTAADTALQLYNAANEIPRGTGNFGATQQQLRKLAIGALQLAGADVPPTLAGDAAAFEKMNFAGLNFVQSAAHGFSPRAALQIVKMIQSVKPGDKTTALGIKQIIEQEVMPSIQKDNSLYGQAVDYYNKNPLANDAMSTLPGKNPLEKFSVKHDLRQVNPGDYYTDPNNGSLRQRPAQ